MQFGLWQYLKRTTWQAANKADGEGLAVPDWTPAKAGFRTPETLPRYPVAYCGTGGFELSEIRRLNIQSATALASIASPPSSTDNGVAPRRSNHWV